MTSNKLPFPKNLKSHQYSRTSYLKNATIAEKLVGKLKLNQYYHKNVQVLDVYSNNLIFSTALYNNLLPSKYVLMDPRKEFKKYTAQHLKALEEQGVPNTFKFLSLDPFSWESYLEITDKEPILTPGFETRDHIHEKFLFTGSVNEEGLIMQWISCLGHQNWIQRFGSVKMLLWIPQSTAIKLTATASSKGRHKCSVTCQTFSDPKVIAITESAEKSKFDPIVMERDMPVVLKKSDFSSSSLAMSLVEINPKDCDVGDIYSWEFVVKNLMILSNQYLGESVKNLGPGAEEFFGEKLDQELLNKKITDMECEDFIKVSQLFETWPFKPNTMLDFLV